MDPSNAYPASASERTAWIRAHRERVGSSRPALAMDRPSGTQLEYERGADGRVRPVLAMFLVNRECPWHCAMCDLWKYATRVAVPAGSIPRQIRSGLESLSFDRAAGSLKLYNAGSFFDAGAVAPEDDGTIAALCCGFRTLIVESHPALVGPRCHRFRGQLDAATHLEVAMGLETAHPGVLEKLNKRITVEGFRAAARRLKEAGIGVRVFVLIKPPFLVESEAVGWACRSVEVAFEAGADVVVLIPTRGGNGALEALEAGGEFRRPSMETVLEAFRRSLAIRRGRVFLDLWDLGRWCGPGVDAAEWEARLESANRTQVFDGLWSEAVVASPVAGADGAGEPRR